MPEAAQTRTSIPRRTAIVMGLAFVAAGAYPTAAGLGLAAVRPGSLHAPLWVVALAGICFMLIGVSLLIPERHARLRGFIIGVFVTAFAATFDWIAFGPGERHFGGGLSLGGLRMPLGSGEISGRIVFGCAAAVLDAFAVWGWYRWASDVPPAPGDAGPGAPGSP